MLCVTGSLLAFEQFYILTKGGPDNSTITVVQLIYNVAFQGQNDLGVAGALSVIVLLALVVINIAQLRALPPEGRGLMSTDHAPQLGETDIDAPSTVSIVAPSPRAASSSPDDGRRHRPAHAVLGVHRRRSP